MNIIAETLKEVILRLKVESYRVDRQSLKRLYFDFEIRILTDVENNTIVQIREIY